MYFLAEVVANPIEENTACPHQNLYIDKDISLARTFNIFYLKTRLFC